MQTSTFLANGAKGSLSASWSPVEVSAKSQICGLRFCLRHDFGRHTLHVSHVTETSKHFAVCQKIWTACFFDDCIYSGKQMAEHLAYARQTCPTQQFYCVPAFWHENTLLKTTDIHPAVRDAVLQRSSTLSRASDFMDQTFWAIRQGQTLTFLQTKQPDSLSFPPFLWKTVLSPFNDSVLTDMYLDELGLLSIAENCEREYGPCPPALYKKRLQTIFSSTFDEPCTSDVLTSLASTSFGGRRAKRTKSRTSQRAKRTKSRTSRRAKRTKSRTSRHR